LRRIVQAVIISAAVGGWFLWNAWRGLFVYFNTDDMMNLYLAWNFPLRHLIIANLTPFTKVYRPAGAAFYRTLYDVFGLHPLPFRIAIYCALALNIALIYWLAKLLSESAEVGVLAALLGAYHNRLLDVYIFGGTVYDVLCFTFYVLAVCVYVRSRANGAAMSWRAFAVFIVLNVLALNSKEMAVTLPAVLIAYEWLYHLGPLAKARSSNIWRWAPAWLSLAMTVVVAKIRTGTATAFSGNAEYALHFSLHQYFLTSREFLDELFLREAGSISTTKVVLIFAVVWVIAIASRRRDLLLSAFFITVTPLPVNFIPSCGFFAMYLPLAGWAIYCAILIVVLRNRLLERGWHRPRIPDGWQPERVVLFVCVLWALFDIHARDQGRTFRDADNLTEPLPTLAGSLARIPASIPMGGGVLFLNDAIEDRWSPVFVVRLFYRDATIRVDRDWEDPKAERYGLTLVLCDRGYCELK
jgi:hypothetical protein